MRNVKKHVLNNLLYARRDWDRLLNGISEADLAKPGVCDQRSVKDLIAHITWYDRQMEEMLRSGKVEESPLWSMEPKERNEHIRRHHQMTNADELKQQSLQAFARLLDAVESADSEAFLNPGYYDKMQEDWQPLDIIAINTWGHYAHHARQIEEFLAGE